MSDKKHWIVKIVPVLAFTAGIIIASVGGVMTLSSTAKLALFEHGPYSYVSKDQCRYDYNRAPMPVDLVMLKDIEGSSMRGVDSDIEGNQTYVRTVEEIEACLLEKRNEEKKRFQHEKKEGIVDGLAALIIGFLLIIFFRKKK